MANYDNNNFFLGYTVYMGLYNTPPDKLFGFTILAEDYFTRKNKK